MSNKVELNIQDTIMKKVISGEIKMKPKWYFIVGSAVSLLGLVGLILAMIFLTSLSLFLILKRGPGIGRTVLMLESFPMWIPFIALVLLTVGTLMLKRYEFSYKQNRTYIIIAIIAAVLVASATIYYLGLDEIWFKRGPIKRLFMENARLSINKPYSRYHTR